MRLEITGMKPLSTWDEERNAEALAEYNEAKERGDAPETYEPPYRERPETVTLEDTNDKAQLIIRVGDSYSREAVRISVEDLKRALKVF